MKRERCFGVEVEISREFFKTVKLLKSKNLLKRGQYKIDSNVGIKNDGKKFLICQDLSTETEISSPKISFKSKNWLHFKKIIRELKKANVKITRNDSVHIHIQVGNLESDKILFLWMLYERKILKMFPKYRYTKFKDGWPCYAFPYMSSKRVNYFSNLYNVFKEIKKENLHNEHHRALSLEPITEKGTVEFRLMEGNININDIENWIKFCLNFVEQAEKLHIFKWLEKQFWETKSLHNKDQNFIKNLNIKDKKVKNWIIKRLKKFRTKK